MRLSQQLIREQEKIYAEEEDMYEEEVARLGRSESVAGNMPNVSELPSAFENDEWSLEDLEWIIEWKVGVFAKPILGDFRSNDDKVIRQKVEEAVRGPDIRSRVETLTSLKGVGVPVASAILTFIDPDTFTVIDGRAWEALEATGYIPEFQELSEDPTVEEYLYYLGVCQALSNEYDVSLRTLDMALWSLGDN